MVNAGNKVLTKSLPWGIMHLFCTQFLPGIICVEHQEKTASCKLGKLGNIKHLALFCIAYFCLQNWSHYTFNLE